MMVINRRRMIINLLVLVLFAFALTGCRGEGANNPGGEKSGDRSLKVGYIDSDKLLFEYPDFKKFLEKKQEESLEIRNKIAKGSKLRNLSEEDRKYIKKATVEFMKKEEVILRKFVDQVRKASNLVKDEKKMDLIINSAASNPVREYGGIDITDDVHAKMIELRKKGNSNKKEENKKK